ncbi:MAG: methyltransferase domain-containing protein [Chloroflexi bacterium]|nr:methyltransferase domain-containing protein [Chloroflexota bacterium]
MHLLCPNCRKNLTPQTWSCPNGHKFRYENGVLILLESAFGEKLHAFTTQFSKLRQKEGRRLMDSAVYEHLPYIQDARGEHEWRVRRYDLSVIRKLLKSRKTLRVLEIGAWNGWLSHHLSQMGYQVIAVDYFADEYDGLGAKKFYSSDWQAIQMDLRDLSIINQQFDLVILNRCVQFFENPPAYTMMAAQKVAPGGNLLLLGLQFFSNPRKKIQGVLDLQTHFNQNGFDFFKPIKGYLDESDKQQMHTQEIKLFLYPQLWLSSAKAHFIKTSPKYYYGCLTK